MKNNKLNIKQILFICFLILIIVLIIVIGGLIAHINTLKHTSSIQHDTITNTVVIEKIKEELKEKEEQLYNYNYEYNKEKERVKSLDDSSAIKLFFELTSE